ncbi:MULTISPECIES: autotransporter domain-containing protein [unclassified Bradyrhizobium]|uniref:autotransporter outer membrane beta-barrel domain-containing protein n=1 Tax=unclassified Bradyrhizobium TaxID=2631580 RepID=UPI0028E1D240|nr:MULTISPECIES: autotransporter domain-containing protein [unclassified Bradyrhizobium]
MRHLIVGLSVTAACVCGAVPATATDLWQFDFTSPRGNGQFQINPANFVIPTSAGSPTTFNVVGTNIAIDAGGIFGAVQYGSGSASRTSCTPAECSVTFSVANAVPGFGTYNVLLQLNFERTWVNWTTPSQQTIQMFLSSNPAATSYNWNDVGSVTRTVVSVAPGWLATPANSDWNAPTNWSVGSVPTSTDTPRFGASSATTIDIKQATQVGGLSFLGGASAYTFNVTGSAGGAASLVVGGAGIDDQSGNRPHFVVGGVSSNLGTLQFTNSATAGDSFITTGAFGITRFTGASSGGTAQLVTNRDGVVDISGLTSSGTAVGSIAGAGGYVLGSKNLTTGSLNTDTEVSGTISGVGGSLTKVGTGALTLSGANSYSGGTQLNGGSLVIGNTGALGSGTLSMANGTTLSFAGSANFAVANNVQISGTGHFSAPGGTTQTVQGTISDGGVSGAVAIEGAGTTVFSGANSYTGGTVINAGTLRLVGAGTLGAVSGSTTVLGGTLDLGGTTQTQNGGFILAGGSIKNGALLSPGDFTVQSGIANIGLDGTGGLTKTGSGTFVLAGTASYTGATNINGGVLEVDGLITGTSAVNLNAGVLMGTGTIDPLTVSINNGATFAPGNGTPGSSMAIVGNLAFQSGAAYLVQISPTASSFANVSGVATLGGATVSANFNSGSYVEKRYTILSAAGGISGTFASLVNTNLPSGFKSSLSYGANDTYLDLSLDFTPAPGAPNYGAALTINQKNVANALTGFFDTTGGIPMVYGALTPAGLTQASGELAAAPQQTTFNAMGQFVGLLTVPLVSQRSGVADVGAVAFMEEEGVGTHPSRKLGDAFATFTKAAPAPFVPRWSVWTAGFGGSQSTEGNAVNGSNRTTGSIYGTAVGADYLLTPDTVAGFALAGGGTSFAVGGLGSGRSDLFQAGAYVRHWDGPSYATAALAYGWQDITTDRTLMIAGFDRLRAEFNANAYSARVEGGYRLAAPGLMGASFTPYAGVQFTTFDLPGYAERVISGSRTFALAYGAKLVTDTRSELGFRTDQSLAVPNGVLSLRGRLAWARDFNPDRSFAATFQSLPGASFAVHGASQAPDSALTTAGAEMSWANGWSAAATFDGEFSDVTRSYAGKAVVRYVW